MIIFSFIRGFFVDGDLMCFLEILVQKACKPFSVSKRTAREELENIFLFYYKVVNFSNPQLLCTKIYFKYIFRLEILKL